MTGHASDPISYSWGSFVNQIGCGPLLPTMLVWATSGLAYSIRGRVTGIWQASFALGLFLSGMSVTLLSEHLGGLLATFFVIGNAALVSAILAALAGAVWRRNSASAALILDE